ncbi:acetyl-CoA carboxylase biotin carboxyl carrier protein [Paenalcaligenes sp. Me131]|uniref:acetyl-CoA carboxylase biotin carboxyl carrier protein n=1 Tax=Paenalcaligenes sp. Me131 TaxID=3392636 RepID=UPI003D2E47CF
MSQKIDLNEAKAIINWVNLNDDIRELSLKYGGLELFISRNQHSAPSATAPTPVAAAPVPASVSSPVVAAPAAPVTAPVTNTKNYQPAADEIVIRAPMVGTFYASPKPGDPAFVKEGDEVNAQSVLCIIEVMKLMNNIEAGVTGVVHKILVQNEQPVEYNQALIVIKLK